MLIQDAVDTFIRVQRLADEYSRVCKELSAEKVARETADGAIFILNTALKDQSQLREKAERERDTYKQLADSLSGLERITNEPSSNCERGQEMDPKLKLAIKVLEKSPRHSADCESRSADTYCTCDWYNIREKALAELSLSHPDSSGVLECSRDMVNTIDADLLAFADETIPKDRTTYHYEKVYTLPMWCAKCGRIIPAGEAVHINHEAWDSGHGLQFILRRYHDACCPYMEKQK